MDLTGENSLKMSLSPASSTLKGRFATNSVVGEGVLEQRQKYVQSCEAAHRRQVKKEYRGGR
jgi:hypothetical protein